MALLDQLFRLRGAPRAANRPVTLGALVAALDEAGEPAEPAAPERPVDAVPPKQVPEPAPPEGPRPERPGEPPIPAPISPPEPPRPAPSREPDAEPDQSSTSRNASPPAQRRNATRFNPFQTPADSVPHARADEPANRVASGPCLDDPALPPLRLQAHVKSESENRPVVLGAAASLEAGEAPVVLRQIDAPAIRLAPVKSPSRLPDPPAPAKVRPLLLRLEIQAEASLDVVAFKQYAAKFPGVVKCVISNARD